MYGMPPLEMPEGTDLAFNVIHGTFGEDGGLQSYLENLGIRYTGAGGVASSERGSIESSRKACSWKTGRLQNPR